MAIFMPWRQPGFGVGWAVFTEGHGLHGKDKPNKNLMEKLIVHLLAFFQSMEEVGSVVTETA